MKPPTHCFVCGAALPTVTEFYGLCTDQPHEAPPTFRGMIKTYAVSAIGTWEPILRENHERRIRTVVPVDPV